MTRATVVKMIGGGALVLALGFGGGAAIATGPLLSAPTGLSADTNIDTEPMPAPTYGVNRSGETFGSASASRTPDEEPDLIEAVATNGKAGYIRRGELEAVDGTAAMLTFASPEDALAWQAGTDGEEFSIPVYLEDGATVIGSFVITSAVPPR